MSNNPDSFPPTQKYYTHNRVVNQRATQCTPIMNRKKNPTLSISERKRRTAEE